MELKTAYLSIGANIGDKFENLRASMRMLKDCGCEISKVSSLYLTKPVGVEDQPDFYNAVLEIKTFLNADALLSTCLEIEKKLGRKRTFRWAERVIDLDILLFDDIICDDENLTLPHPRMLERAFVLIPLAEIAPEIKVCEKFSALAAAEGISSEGVVKIQSEDWSG